MLSIFDLFKIGIGPSSSHTVGPMKAAKTFVEHLASQNLAPSSLARLEVHVYGSLALTGEGHGTPGAILAGLLGMDPATVDPELPKTLAFRHAHSTPLAVPGFQELAFSLPEHYVSHRTELLPFHSNGMRFRALDAGAMPLLEEVWYSVGGGFVLPGAVSGRPASAGASPESISENLARAVPWPFNSAMGLLDQAKKSGLSIAQIMLANETTLAGGDEASVRQRIGQLALAMSDCVERGCATTGMLAGGLNLRRRAPGLYSGMAAREAQGIAGNDLMLWPLVYALAVSEENAAGGRVVTAPTNGAAGIIPAVLQYYRTRYPNANQEGVVDFLLTAAAVGILYKLNGSISGAEVGCQGEVGVACSMAAGAYCAVTGGSPEQVENAAEIAMEHHLGLTCDPVAGLVQVPCIERNGLAAEQAIKVAQLALLEDGSHLVSLDTVIATMYRTGLDMQASYKETSLGGLALTVNLPNC